MAGELIPEVGSILSYIGQAIELKNEVEIKKRLNKMSQLIRDDQKNLIAKYVASKITIKMRKAIENLKIEDIKMSVTDFDKLMLMFEGDNVYKIKAGIDLKVIEAIILG